MLAPRPSGGLLPAQIGEPFFETVGIVAARLEEVRQRSLGCPADFREINVKQLAIPLAESSTCSRPAANGRPCRRTCHFALWDWDGTLERIHHALYVETRERAGREASPTAAIIDSKSAKAAQKGAPGSTRKAMMRARKSRAASGTSSSTRSVSC